jgi:FkbM family methyltransferase
VLTRPQLRGLFAAAVLLVGCLGFVVFHYRPRWTRPIQFHLIYLLGRSEGCSFQQAVHPINLTVVDLTREIEANSILLKSTEEGINLWRTPNGDFWAPAGNSVSFLIAEQNLEVYGSGKYRVQTGDVVLDCGANIGTFTRLALSAGAEIIVAIEPSPLNVVCLRKNFETEIQTGKVIVVDKALWHEQGHLDLALYRSSALDSLVMKTRREAGRSRRSVRVSLVTIDQLVSDLDLPKVDYIKMDIEGAERNALRGAELTLKKYKPRMSIATDNLPDDIRVIPEVVRKAVPSYRVKSGPCRMIGGFTTRPEVVYFH